MSNTVEMYSSETSNDKNKEYDYQFKIISGSTEYVFILRSDKQIDQNQLEKIKKELKNFDVLNANEDTVKKFLKEKGIILDRIKLLEVGKYTTAHIIKEEANTKTYTFQVNQPPLEKEITFSTNTSLNDDQKEAIRKKLNELHQENKNPTSKDLFKAINDIATLRGYIRGGSIGGVAIPPLDSEIKYSIKSQDGTLSLNLRTRNGLPPGQGTVDYLQGRIDKIEAEKDPVERNREIKILQKDLFRYMNILGDGKENNLLGADVVDRSPNLEPEKVTISFAPDPKHQTKLIYKIDTGAEIFYVQVNKKQLPESAPKELAKLASDAILTEAAINKYLEQKNINGKVIDPTDDIKNSPYIMPQTFQVNQLIAAQQTNLNINAGYSPPTQQLKMG